MSAERSDGDVADDVAARMERAEEADDETRLDALERVHETLESELDDGGEAPPARH